jgi:hypothetical protein
MPLAGTLHELRDEGDVDSEEFAELVAETAVKWNHIVIWTRF